MRADVAGRRILIVEDEAAIALLIEDMLIDLGCEVAASVASVPEAMAFLDASTVDAAVVDVNLDGHDSFELAADLRRRSIPFVFSTGYGARGVAAAFRDSIVLEKPFRRRQLAEALAGALSQGA